MKRSLRYLRIAVSATCLIACVLMIVLWVRSYWWLDILQCGSERAFVSHAGTIQHTQALDMGLPFSYWRVVTFSESTTPMSPPRYSFAGIGYSPGDYWAEVVIPNWLSLFLLTTLAAAPWLHWRFSLRTLLLATTLIALVLGLVVWAIQGSSKTTRTNSIVDPMTGAHRLGKKGHCAALLS
jgi:hypothetical protein